MQQQRSLLQRALDKTNSELSALELELTDLVRNHEASLTPAQARALSVIKLRFARAQRAVQGKK
jgi:hypothetical protein